MSEPADLRGALWALFDAIARTFGIVWLVDRLTGIMERRHQ